MGLFDKYGIFRVDPDGRYAEDRKVQPVKVYKLNKEELEKYKNISPYKKPSMVDIYYKKRKEKKDMEEAAKYEVKKLTKEVVQKLLEEGKSKEEIFNIFKDTWEGHPRTLKASIARLSGECKQDPEAEAKVKYYISTGYDNKVKAEQLSKVIDAAGGEITYRWWMDEYTEEITELAKIGEAELKGIENADIIIIMLPGKFGTHTEFGAALALGKKIVLFSADGFGTMPFYYVPGIKQVIGSELELVAEVLKAAKED